MLLPIAPTDQWANRVAASLALGAPGEGTKKGSSPGPVGADELLGNKPAPLMKIAAKHSFGGRAVSRRRPLALRPHLAMGLPFRSCIIFIDRCTTILDNLIIFLLFETGKL